MLVHFWVILAFVNTQVTKNVLNFFSAEGCRILRDRKRVRYSELDISCVLKALLIETGLRAAQARVHERVCANARKY